MSEQKVVYEIKLHRSVLVLLWVFALGLLFNALPKGALVPEALAQLADSPTIMVRLQECTGSGLTVYDCGEIDVDD